MGLTHISLTLMSGPRDGEMLRFKTNPGGVPTTLSFGRRETCDIPLAYDSQVSRLHAHLILEGDQFFIEDLSSRNGTFIDKQRIEGKVAIHPGAMFRVGRTWVRLDSLPPDETQAAEAISNDENLDPF